jgi:putative holliday junction resolvase
LLLARGTPYLPSALRPRTLALDLGKARVGVAIDDDLGLMAHPRGVLPGKDRGALLKSIAKIAAEEKAGRIVVGLPVDMRGHEGDAAKGARLMAQSIADATGLDVELWDERMTTQVAARALASSEVRGKKAKAHIDEASAVAILQSWLDARRHAKEEGQKAAKPPRDE